MVQLIRMGMVGDRMLIEGIRAWTARAVPDLRLVAGAPTVGALLAGIRGDRPRVVLLDALLSDRSDPVANVRALTRERYLVVVVGSGPWSPRLDEVVGAGACGCVTKDQELRALADTVRLVAAGGFAGPSPADDGVLRRPHLSAREWAVLHAYTSGMTMDAAARHVGIRPATAKTYLARVKAKYEEIGRPAYTKLELADRVREDCPSPGDCPGHERGTGSLPPPAPMGCQR